MENGLPPTFLTNVAIRAGNPVAVPARTSGFVSKHPNSDDGRRDDGERK